MVVKGRCELVGFDFDTQEEARDFIEKLKSIYTTYGFATLSDAYDLHGDDNYGPKESEIKLPKFEDLAIEERTVYTITIPYNFKED